MLNDSYLKIKNDLVNIGVSSGDLLVVHSSLKSMGHVEGGAKCVIDAICDVLGEDGTLLMPTFTYSTSYADSFFSNKDTPSCVGLITETFRKIDGVFRTNHPTHSVAIRGKLVKELTEGEELDDTPMGIHSPYRRIALYNAKILMLGCSLSHNSFMHALEEDANSFYSLRDHQEYTVVDANGEISRRRIKRHNFMRQDGSIIQRYDRTLDVLDENDYKISTIHGAKSVLINSVKLKKKALLKMQQSPLYFIDDPCGYYPEYR